MLWIYTHGIAGFLLQKPGIKRSKTSGRSPFNEPQAGTKNEQRTSAMMATPVHLDHGPCNKRVLMRLAGKESMIFFLLAYKIIV
jgi:hypothetical protein